METTSSEVVPVLPVTVADGGDDYQDDEVEHGCICGNPFGDAKKTGAVLVYDPTPQKDDNSNHNNKSKPGNPVALWFQKMIKRQPQQTNDSHHDKRNNSIILQKQNSLQLNSINGDVVDDDEDKVTDVEDDDEDSTGNLRVPDASSCPVLLTPDLFLELSKALPWSLRHSTWERCFCIARDGDSIQHMLRLCQPYNQTLLILQTTKGQVLGAFCTGQWQLPSKKNSKNNNNYYGNGQSFLFHIEEEDEEEVQEQQDASLSFQKKKQEVSVYRWTGKNEYCQLCSLESGRIAMGGGNGDFGLVLEDNFSIGHSGHCATYANPPLAGSNEVSFEIAALELYGPRNPYLSF